MGHKVHPKIFRLAVMRNWDARWFAKKHFASFLREDVELRDFFMKTLKDALLDRVEIDRTRQNLTITIYAAKPGFIIGRGGAGIEDLKKKIKQKFFSGKKTIFQINVKEIPRPSLSARVIAQQIAFDLEKRLPFRRSMKQSIERVLKSGAEGVKVVVAGRLNGAEIARIERLARGKIPMHNLRADIDFARIAAKTSFGSIGVKVWINRGEVFEKIEKREEDFAKTTN